LHFGKSKNLKILENSIVEGRGGGGGGVAEGINFFVK